VVASRYVEDGAYLRAGVPLLRLVDTGGLRVRFAVPEQAADKPSTGTLVHVHIDSHLALSATVEHVSPEIDAAARMVFAEARVDLPNQGVEKITLVGRTVRVTK
jgi:hypothetical protein